jgi:hypothetical protein
MLAALHGERGLTDNTIKKFRYGCVPLGKDGKWFHDEFEGRGLDPATLTPEQLRKGCLRIPPGILIPWFVGGEVWKLCVYRPDEPDKKRRYGQVMGSVDALYNVDAVQYDAPTMIVEAEFCVASVDQEAGDLIIPVATGSAAKGRQSRWLADLAMASYVIQSFDDDPAGDEGAEYWLKVLKNCIRFQPCLYKDPNDMLQNLSPEELRNWVLWGMHAWEYGQYLDSLPYPPPPAAYASENTLARVLWKQLSPQNENTYQQDIHIAEKHMEMIDGIRVFSGYSQKEYMQRIIEETLAERREVLTEP